MVERRRRRTRLARIPFRSRLQSWLTWKFIYPRTAALARAGDIQALMRRLNDVANPPQETTFSERAVIAVALGQLKAQAAIPQLAALLDREERGEVRLCACEALRHIGGPDAARATRPALRDEVFAVRKAAIAAVSPADPEASNALAELATSDPRQLIRLAAVEALGLTKSDEWVAVLRSVAERDRLLVALAAILALREIGSPAALDALTALKRGRPRVGLRLPLRRQIRRLSS